MRFLLLLIAGIWLAGCNDAGEPILRGVKQGNSELSKAGDTSAQPGSEGESPEDNTFDVEELFYQPQATDQKHTNVARRILDLNLPHEIKHGDIHANTEPQWRSHALVGETQTFPNFFEHKAEVNQKPSAIDFSGKVHWQEATEDLTIPPLNTIEGLELEISVKTR